MEDKIITLQIGLRELLCQNQWFSTDVGIINVDFKSKISDLVKLMVNRLFKAVTTLKAGWPNHT